MRKFLREYRLEISALIIALLGVFLISQRGRIESTLKASYAELVQYLNSMNQMLETDARRFLGSQSLSVLIGWLFVLLAILFVILRVRYRFTRSEHWRATVCPKCGSELHRIHRNFFDRLLSHTLMPNARRYRCESDECGWKGLRRARRQDHLPPPLQEVTDTP